MNQFSFFLQDYNLSKFKNCLSQNYISSLGSAAVLGLAGLTYVALTPKKYVGDFSIVLAENRPVSTKLSSSNPFLAGLGQGLTMASDINTQVAILQSPSILMPVYTSEISGESTHISSYADWLKKLKVRLVRGTKILEISYTDTSKDRIKSVLDAISSQYKVYSLKDKNQELQDNILFTNKESERLRNEAELANKKVDAFVLKYGIIEPDTGPTGPPGASIITRATGQQFRNNNFAIPFPQQNEAYVQGDLSNELLNLEKSIFLRSKTYTLNDPELKELKRKRDALKDFISQSAGGAVSNLSLANINTSPTDVYLKYKSLKRESDNLNSAYNEIETRRTSLNIRKNEINRPWELISDPVVNPSQVWPRPLRITIFSSFFGFLLGLGYGFYQQYKSDPHSKARYLDASLPLELLATLPKHPTPNYIDVLANYITSKFHGEVINVYTDALTASLIRGKRDESTLPFKLRDLQAIFTDTATELSIVVISGSTNDGLLSLLKSNLAFLRPNLAGWIWLPR